MAFPYFYKMPLSSDETRQIEFKEVRGVNPVKAIVNTADEYAVAFLNSEGGKILWGIRDSDKVVVGVALSDGDRDRLRRDVMAKLGEIQPQIDPSQFRLEIHKLEGGDENRFVIELSVPPGAPSTPYYTSSHQCFVRLEGVKRKLTGPQLTDWIQRRILQTRKHHENDAPNPELLTLAQRVRRIFSAHGLRPNHLARFFAARDANFSITLSDQESDRSLLQWLNEEKIAWIAETFGIRREWIDGEDEEVHEWQMYDKDPERFLSTISQHTDALIYEKLPLNADAWFLRYGVGKDWETRGYSQVFVIIRIPLAWISSETIIYRYLSDFQPYAWDEGRTAIQLRAWARLLNISKCIPCFAREVPLRLAGEIESNAVFLHEVIESPRQIKHCCDKWHPEDYALYPEESVVAKPDAFFEQVIDFLRQHNLPYQATQLFNRKG